MSQGSVEVTQPYNHGSGYCTATSEVSLHSEPSVNQGDALVAEQMDPVEVPIPWRQLPLRMRIRHDPYLMQLLNEPHLEVEENPEVPESPRHTSSEAESNTLVSSRGSNRLQEQPEDSKYDYQSRPMDIVYGKTGAKLAYVGRILEANTQGLQNHTALHGRRFCLAWIARARESYELDQLSEEAIENSIWTISLLSAIPDGVLWSLARTRIEPPLPDFYVCLEKLEALVNELFPDD